MVLKEQELMKKITKTKSMPGSKSTSRTGSFIGTYSEEVSVYTKADDLNYE